MKTELLIFAIMAMVVSSLLNANVQAQSNDHLALAKHRIENATHTHAKSLHVKTVSKDKNLTKPNEG